MPRVRPVTVVSVYNVLDGHAMANLLRVLADLVPLFESPDGARLILAGDLNVYEAMGEDRARRTAALFDVLRAYDLVPAREATADRPAGAADCPCGAGGLCSHLLTWGRFDLDHVFVSMSLADQVRSLEIDRRAVAIGLSDHAALVLNLELSPTPVARPWDVESFVEEVALRHGSDAGATGATLVAWAEDKERRLPSRDRDLTRFVLPAAIDPTIWFRLTFADRTLVPQWLFGIRAGSGEVFLSFQYMTHPPFNDEAGREPLRAMLNAIPGVEIPAGRLRGRPGFPIAILADPPALERFIAVLDRVVDETRPTARQVGGTDEAHGADLDGDARVPDDMPDDSAES